MIRDRLRGHVPYLFVAMIWMAVAADEAALGAISFSTIALTGQSAPGAAPDQTFSQFNAPTINNGGKVAFTGTLTGQNIASFNDRGVWSSAMGPLNLVAREGDQAPGIGLNVVYASFNNPAINNAGHIAIRGLVTGPGVTNFDDQITWIDAGTGLDLVIRERQQAPGTAPGTHFFNTTGPVLTNTGRITIHANLIDGPVTSDDNAGIWTNRDGDLSLLMRQGQQAPGLAPGVVFKTLQGGGTTVNNLGFAGVRPTLAGPGIDGSNDQGIWVERNGALDLVVRESDSVPGQASSAFTQIFPHSMNDSGRIAFRGLTNGASGDGIWSDGKGDLAPVAMAGEPAPGVGLGFSIFLDPLLNENGDTAFVARFGPGSGLFSEGGDGLHLVARTGAAVPGADDGAVFGNFAFPTFPANFVLNGNGDVAFLSNLSNTPDNQGLFAEIDGVLTTIVRKGDLLEVTPGDFRTISFLRFDGISANQSGAASSFNDLGQIAFAAEFTDGTEGVFIVDTIPIPEPATALLLAIGLSACRRRHRS